MERRKQSVITLSFESEREVAPKFYTREEAQKQAASGNELSQSLMALCKEIAGALLAHHAAGRDLSVVKETILEGLVEKIQCAEEQAERLIELAQELIHVHAYGDYRRNPLELSLLIRAATGQPEVDALQN